LAWLELEHPIIDRSWKKPTA